jgi:hypothetical protein
MRLIRQAAAELVGTAFLVATVTGSGTASASPLVTPAAARREQPVHRAPSSSL